MSSAVTQAPQGRDQDDLYFYVLALGGAEAAAQQLEVSGRQMNAWLARSEPVPGWVRFWLDDAAGGLPSRSADE